MFANHSMEAESPQCIHNIAIPGFTAPNPHESNTPQMPEELWNLARLHAVDLSQLARTYQTALGFAARCDLPMAAHHQWRILASSVRNEAEHRGISLELLRDAGAGSDLA